MNGFTKWRFLFDTYRVVSILIVLSIGLVPARQVMAQLAIRIDKSFIKESTDKYIYIYTDSLDNLTIQSIQAKKVLFKPFSINHPTGVFPHWVYFVLSNKTAHSQQLILRYDQIFADTLILFDTNVAKAKSIDSPQSWKQPTPDRPYPYIRYPVFKLSLPPNTTRTIWIQWRKRDGDVLKSPFTLWNETAFFDYYNQENLFRGFFYGWLFLVSLFAGLLFIFLHSRLYLYYSLSVFSLILILAATGGTLNQLGWIMPAFIAGPAGNAFFNMAYILFNLSFTIDYIEVNRIPKWLLVFVRNFSICCVIVFCSLIINNGLYYDSFFFKVVSYFAFIHVFLVFSLLGYGILRKSIGAKFYVGAISPLFISSMAYWSATLGILTYGEWIITCFKLSVLIEIFVLSVGLAYRYLVLPAL